MLYVCNSLKPSQRSTTFVFNAVSVLQLDVIIPTNTHSHTAKLNSTNQKPTQKLMRIRDGYSNRQSRDGLTLQTDGRTRIFIAHLNTSPLVGLGFSVLFRCQSQRVFFYFLKMLENETETDL